MLDTVVTILVVLLLIMAAVVAFAATRPGTFRVARSARIAAPPNKIYPLIDDFHRWTAWSPYEGLDPNLKRTYGRVPSGVGATYAWEGNNNAGAGSMEIVAATAPSKVTIKLEFTKPFAARNIAEFTLVSEGAGTTVTWSVQGPRPLMMKVMGLFLSMDKMLGKNFETGLASLRTVAET